jgi:hypothetical protein
MSTVCAWAETPKAAAHKAADAMVLIAMVFMVSPWIDGLARTSVRVVVGGPNV